MARRKRQSKLRPKTPARVRKKQRARPRSRHHPELVVELLECGLHPGGRANRPKCVVLVEPRQPEDGHHGVADELFDGAAVPLELGA